jgi:hypothetical protein
VRKFLTYTTICYQTASFKCSSEIRGSVLDPILFNLFMSNLPSFLLESVSVRWRHCADTSSKKKLKSAKSILKKTSKHWVDSFINFFIDNCLIVQFDNTLINHVDHPKYLGITLDRLFSYKPHMEKTGNDGELSCQLSSKIVRHLMRFRSTYVSCKMATISWIVGENHGCQMSQ